MKAESLTADELIDKLEWCLNHMALRCQCVNWMGGCSREDSCSLGWNRDALDAIASYRSHAAESGKGHSYEQ